MSRELKSMQKTGEGLLKELSESAKFRVRRGYYAVGGGMAGRRRSLVGALRKKGRVPIIAEVKFRSPSEGRLAEPRDVGRISAAYEKGGASAISVLTEPDHFDGRVDHLPAARRAVGLPVMMKDVIVDEQQIRAARSYGADAVLLIASILTRGMGNEQLAPMVRLAHDQGLEVVVEVHDEVEYSLAVSSRADVIGLNNRDLDTLSVSLEVSKKLLLLPRPSKPVICESGITSREEIDILRRLGADGFLVGSALMKSGNPVSTLKALSRL